jgi:hypothetical protein
MRPFMGPNLYITPPASFTHFHQDGFGTVDSGHVCLQGYNEVVMLRRLPVDHRENAMNILTRKSSEHCPFDGLYKQPHGQDNVSLFNKSYLLRLNLVSKMRIPFYSLKNHLGPMSIPLKNAEDGGKCDAIFHFRMYFHIFKYFASVE